MNPFVPVVDIITDIVAEKKITPRKVRRGFKAGYFASRPYLDNRVYGSARPVITERILMEKAGSSGGRVKLKRGSVMTPLAKLLVEEGRVSVEYE